LPCGYRAWRQLSRDGFATDLMTTRLCSDLAAIRDMSADDLAQLYDDVMTDLLDRHCPVVTVRRRARPMTPWFDADCRATAWLIVLFIKCSKRTSAMDGFV